MRLKAGAAAEYQKRHAAIWPELMAELKAAVISSYSIFLDEETDTLFAVQMWRIIMRSTSWLIPFLSANGGATWLPWWKCTLTIQP
jgi:L-rhamnose mutarotase